MKLISLCCILIFSSCVSSSSNFRNTYYGKNSKKSSVEITESTILGDASFYGEKYQGRKTANGEIFDMYGYTCAHKTLPFGTKLKVTYLKTNESVIVRVNDRGPFIGNRILDLTKQAATDIGLANDGVGKVKIEIL